MDCVNNLESCLFLFNLVETGLDTSLGIKKLLCSNEDGAIAPFITEAGSTGHISVKGKNNRIIDYNVIRYCPFCAKEIKIIGQ